MADPTALAESMPKILNSFEQRDMRDAYGAVAADQAWRSSGVPDRHKAKSLMRHDAGGEWGAVYRRLAADLDNGPLVVLLGKRGTGKTQLAVCLLADVAMRGRSVRYFKALDLFRELRACYRPDGPDEVRTVQRICTYEALAIDEAQERGETEWENRTLTNIVDRRYDAGRTTVLISNLTPEAFAEAVGTSIVSRVHECGHVVVCDWESFRTKAGGAGRA